MMEPTTPIDEEQDTLTISTSTALTDTSVPDEEWPQEPGDTAIAIGSEAATIARNEALAKVEAAANRPVRRRGRRGPLRRR
jgi:hypothetical protein